MGDATWTTVLLCSALAALIAWDIRVAFFNSTSNAIDTISGQVKAVGMRFRALPFGFGVLGGHFFWPGEKLLDQPWSSIALMLMGLLLSIPLWIRGGKSPLPVVPMWAALLLGILGGHWLWPQ
jgi:hypothetical protein